MIKKIIEIFNSLFKDEKQECFYAIYMDSKGKYIDKKCLFVGTINSSVVHPREVFKEALHISASCMIVAHNHPSGWNWWKRRTRKLTRKKLKKELQNEYEEILDEDRDFT